MKKKAITRRTFLKGAGVALGVMGGMQLMSKGAWSDSAGIKVPYSSGTELPRLKVPPNSADCHHHIYDSHFPVDPSATLLPPMPRSPIIGCCRSGWELRATWSYSHLRTVSTIVDLLRF